MKCLGQLFSRSILCAFLLALLGCAEYTEVAKYSSQNGTIKLKILDPSECDFARVIKVHVIVSETDLGLFDLQLLDCSKEFDYTSFGVSEDGEQEWLVLHQAGNFSKDSIVLIVDKVLMEVYAKKEDFPRSAVLYLEGKKE